MTHTSQCAVKGYCPAEAVADAEQLQRFLSADPCAAADREWLRNAAEFGLAVGTKNLTDYGSGWAGENACRAALRACPGLRGGE